MTSLAAPPPRVRLADQRQQRLALMHYRLMVMMLLFLGLALLIVGRLGWMAVADRFGRAGSAAADLAPARADIVDREGVPLARTIEAWAIAVHPDKLVNDPREVAIKLAQLMPEHSAAAYYKVLTSGKSFVYLRRRATPDLVSAVNAIGEPAIELQQEPERLYPQATLAAHVLGWTNDGKGVFGMEKVLNKRLTDPALLNDPVTLSIDSRVQAALEEELGGAFTKFTAVAGAGVVMNVRTGEIMALASFPTFNPNDPGKTGLDTLRDNANQSDYELGSTFKAIMIANAMQNGVVTSMTQKYDATHPLQIGHFKIHDDEPAGRWLDIPEMMVLSSNIVTAQISEQIGEQREIAFFKALGLDKPPAIELEASVKPLWPKWWGRTTVMTVGYGHGIAVTPLSLAIAYSALVNGGIWRPATLFKTGPDHPVPAGRRVISEAVSQRVRQLLRLVVLPAAGGTGKKADVPGYRIGGKTGTGEKADRGGYNKHLNVSTFAAVFPMDDPKYVAVMTLDSPHATKDTYGFTTAGWTVAPAMGRMIARVGPMLGVTPDLNKDIDESDMLPLIWHAPSAKAKPAATTGAPGAE